MLEVLTWLPVDGHAHAAMRGGRHWLGWTPDTQLAADTWDLHALVAVTGSKKPPQVPTYPRPTIPAPPRPPVGRLSAFPGAIDVRQYVTT